MPPEANFKSDLLNLSVPVHLCRFEVDTNGCWLWVGGVDDKGYGDAGYGRPERKAHRRDEITDEVRAQVREMARDSTITLQAIGERFGLPRPTVNKIVQGYSWFNGERVELERPPCRNCGEAITSGKRSKRFCSKECRLRWNGRRTYRRAHGLDLETGRPALDEEQADA